MPTLSGNDFRICDAPTNRSFNNTHSACAITILARIPTAIKLCRVAREVFVADVMKRADDPTLQQTVIALCEVRVHDHAANERLAVVNRVVACKVL